MNICIDARWIGEKIAGIGRYTFYLLKYLAELDKSNRYLILFHDEKVRDAVCEELGLNRLSSWEIVTLPYGPFSIRGQLNLPRLLKRRGMDIFHSTNFMAPLARFGGKLVITVHDIIPLKFPHYAPRSKKSRLFPVYKWLMKRLASLADLIIVDSENSRRDIMEHLSPRAGKVRVVHLGVDSKYRPIAPEARAKVRKKWGIADKLALFAGRADPYKNLISLVRAAEILNRRGRLHCNVIVAGEEDPRYPEVERYIASRGLGEDVIHAGSLGEDDLIPLYSAADVLVLPSLYEGFGLPPLEAMACGTPVICSNRASIPEVVGDAGILVEPTDVNSIADAMERVFTDDALRKRMVTSGLERAKLFPWQKTAEKTLEIYKELQPQIRGKNNMN